MAELETDKRNGLSAEQADALLGGLKSARWARLDTVEADVLGMLFNQRDRHWTAGWHPETAQLITLLWELDSWSEKPVWHIYLDGALVYKEREGDHPRRSQLFQYLLESDRLPTLDYAEFLAPLTDYRLSADARLGHLQALMQQFLARPEIWDQLKDSLFLMLEDGLNQPGNWPMLDTLKIHRLQCKNMLVSLFRQLIDKGYLRTLEERRRLDAALSSLQADYSEARLRITPLYQAACKQTQEEFRALIMDGLWRIHLHNEVNSLQTEAVPV